MVETLSELLENAANVAEDNGGKLSIASAAVLIAEAYELGMDKATKLLTEAIDLSCEDFFKMKQFVSTGSKLQAVKHVKESAKCGLKEAKDFVDTYCDYVL